MQFGPASPNGSQNRPPAGAGAIAAPITIGVPDLDNDPTLRLLHSCVEAMSLLQAKFVGLEVETQIKLDAAARDVAEMRAALSEATAEIDRGVLRLRDSESRIETLELGAVETARRHAEEISAAREEAATARLRGETDAMAFDHLVGRLAKIEEGLVAKLDHATQEIAEHVAESTLLRTHVDAAQTQAGRLQTKLRDVEATIADQRSRISCLQSKLATASYAIRMEHMSRQLDSPVSSFERDILDLQPLGKDRISAA